MAAQRHKPVRICSSGAAAARPLTIMREIRRTLAAIRAAPSWQCHALVCVQSALWLAPPRQAAGAGRLPWRRPATLRKLSKRPGVVGLLPPLKGLHARPALTRLKLKEILMAGLLLAAKMRRCRSADHGMAVACPG